MQKGERCDTVWLSWEGLLLGAYNAIERQLFYSQRLFKEVGYSIQNVSGAGQPGFETRYSYLLNCVTYVPPKYQLLPSQGWAQLWGDQSSTVPKMAGTEHWFSGNTPASNTGVASSGE